MREEILKRFFIHEATVSELKEDLAGSVKRLSDIASRVAIEDMGGEFTVTRPMLIALCDAVLSGSLPAQELRTIGFALQASDHFIWDGDEDDVLANIIADWSCPEINYPLTVENVSRFRAWLREEDPYPTKAATHVERDGRIISITEKKSVERFWKRKRKRVDPPH